MARRSGSKRPWSRSPRGSRNWKEALVGKRLHPWSRRRQGRPSFRWEEPHPSPANSGGRPRTLGDTKHAACPWMCFQTHGETVLYRLLVSRGSRRVPAEDGAEMRVKCQTVSFLAKSDVHVEASEHVLATRRWQKSVAKRGDNICNVPRMHCGCVFRMASSQARVRCHVSALTRSCLGTSRDE